MNLVMDIELHPTYEIAKKGIRGIDFDIQICLRIGLILTPHSAINRNWLLSPAKHRIIVILPQRL